MTRIKALFIVTAAFLASCVAHSPGQTASASASKSKSETGQTIVDGSVAAEPSTNETNTQADTSKALFENACSSCHDLSLATEKRQSRQMWRETVLNMISQGAPLSDEEAAKVIDYLTTRYGAN